MHKERSFDSRIGKLQATTGPIKRNEITEVLLDGCREVNVEGRVFFGKGQLNPIDILGIVDSFSSGIKGEVVSEGVPDHFSQVLSLISIGRFCASIELEIIDPARYLEIVTAMIQGNLGMKYELIENMSLFTGVSPLEIARMLKEAGYKTLLADHASFFNAEVLRQLNISPTEWDKEGEE